MEIRHQQLEGKSTWPIWQFSVRWWSKSVQSPFFCGTKIRQNQDPLWQANFIVHICLMGGNWTNFSIFWQKWIGQTWCLASFFEINATVGKWHQWLECCFAGKIMQTWKEVLWQPFWYLSTSVRQEILRQINLVSLVWDEMETDILFRWDGDCCSCLHPFAQKSKQSDKSH